MRRYRLLVTAGLTAVLIAGGVTVTAYALIRHDRSYSRPYGIPAAVPELAGKVVFAAVNVNQYHRAGGGRRMPGAVIPAHDRMGPAR
jgi:hypothetical protein